MENLYNDSIPSKWVINLRCFKDSRAIWELWRYDNALQDYEVLFSAETQEEVEQHLINTYESEFEERI